MGIILFKNYTNLNKTILKKIILFFCVKIIDINI